MKRFFLLAMASTVIAISCNDSREVKGQETVSVDSVGQASVVTADTTLSGCYSMFSGRDTASLQLQRTGNTITGSLSYNLFEKDRNDGTFQGEANAGMVSGWYLFRSEGIMSVRQVAWKISNGALWPAMGDVTVRNDTAMFVNPSELSFDTTRAFRKVKCII